MALGTVTPVRQFDVLGNLRTTMNHVVPTVGASYVTGGMPLSAAQLGLNVVLFALPVVKSTGANGPLAVDYIPATGLLVCYGATGEIANATDLSGSVIRIMAFGY